MRSLEHSRMATQQRDHHHPASQRGRAIVASPMVGFSLRRVLLALLPLAYYACTLLLILGNSTRYCWADASRLQFNGVACQDPENNDHSTPIGSSIKPRSDWVAVNHILSPRPSCPSAHNYRCLIKSGKRLSPTRKRNASSDIVRNMWRYENSTPASSPRVSSPFRARTPSTFASIFSEPCVESPPAATTTPTAHTRASRRYGGKTTHRRRRPERQQQHRRRMAAIQSGCGVMATRTRWFPVCGWEENLLLLLLLCVAQMKTETILDLKLVLVVWWRRGKHRFSICIVFH